MAKQFNIPEIYESPLIRTIKLARQAADPRKKDLKPALLDFGPVRFLIPRHFGFCYGVQNAIDIAYRSLEEAEGRRVFLLSEMIHNPDVNADLLARGVQFLYDTDGSVRIPIQTLSEEDIVIVPAFGTTLKIQDTLKERGIDPYQYNTTCPFVEKVWKRSGQLGKKGYNLVIHGKAKHEETRATFSHAARDSKAVIVVLNTDEARLLADFMTGKRPLHEFDSIFAGKCTPDFNPVLDLERFGVINQTTMLATETQEVTEILRQAAIERFGEADITDHVADTSDTLCYATNENQSSTLAVMEEQADAAIVVGGFNSSNTMHLVELLERVFPTYHVRNVSDIDGPHQIRHFDQWKHEILETSDWLKIPADKPLTMVITSGASCPDVQVDAVILNIVSWFSGTKTPDEAVQPYREMLA